MDGEELPESAKRYGTGSFIKIIAPSYIRVHKHLPDGGCLCFHGKSENARFQRDISRSETYIARCLKMKKFQKVNKIVKQKHLTTISVYSMISQVT